jgi:hypothetical protein
MKQLKELVRTCPLCGTDVKYEHSPELVKFANGEDITVREGLKILVIERLRAAFGRKFYCRNCGKTWRTK